MAGRAHSRDIRQQLLALKVPPYLATMAIPFMFFTPGAIDPDSPSVMEIIKGVQRGLRALGYSEVRVTGLFDTATMRALNEVSPPRGSYLSRTWSQLYGDVLRAIDDPKTKADEMRWNDPGLGNYFEFTPPVGPFPGSEIGTVPGALGLGATAVDVGVSLTWGLGTKSKSNCVPIPKSSGTTFQTFRDLQRQINRLLTKVKGGRIGEDGIIGGGTLRAIRKLEPIFLQSLPAENCSQVASQAASLAAKFGAEADKQGVSSGANRGSSVTPTAVAESPGKAVTPSQAIALATAGSGIGAALKKYLPFLLVAGGVAWFAVAQRKRKKKGAK